MSPTRHSSSRQRRNPQREDVGGIPGLRVDERPRSVVAADLDLWVLGASRIGGREVHR